MLGKKSKPVIGKLTGLEVSGNRVAGFMDVATSSTTSPMEFKTQSPTPRRGLKNYDLGGVGLGILAALEKSGEIQANKALYSRNLNRSDPIPVHSAKKSATFRGGFEEMEMDSWEDYTYVTRHGPNKSHTRAVYGDGGEGGRHDRNGFDRSRNTKCVFHISPARFGAVTTTTTTTCPTSDFLSSCHLCQKKLHGKDIYMYRGEKAFCSTECRHRQIVMDERKEKCSSEASRSADVSNSPYTKGQIFSTGILAI